MEGLEPPDGCNQALFNALKKSFALAMSQRLSSGGKIVSVPPTGEENIVHGLVVTEVGGDHILSWSYRNVGDYDQNGTVGISDITPVAVHFTHPVGTDPLDLVIDGDNNGTVGISDITPLAVHFGVNVTSYRVEEAAEETGEYTPLDTVLLSTATGADQGWMQLQFTLPDENARWLRVVPLDSEGTAGVASDAIAFGGIDVPPEVVSVSPLSGAIGASVQFQAVVNGVGPFSYSWDFGGGATPGTSADDQPSVTLSSTSDDYNCSVAVTNTAGTGTFPFTLTVGVPPAVTAVNPTGGTTGASIQFTAAVTGNPPLSYAWDFDGGATPDTPTEESPTVTLGAVGTYGSASVTVTNPFGESFFGFTLTVGGAAPDVASVSPASGYRGAQATISAAVTGTPPLTYSWDFGSAAIPSTSSDTSPLITFNQLGTWPCSLQVTSPYGDDTFNFDLIVTHDPAYDEVEPNNSIPEANVLPAFPVMDWHCRLTQTDDESDFFSFDVGFGDKIDAVITPSSDAPNLDMELQDDLGNVLKRSEWDTGSDGFEYTFAVAGTYNLHCYYASHTTTNAGDYWLDALVQSDQFDEVEDNDVMGEATPITFDHMILGHCGGPAGYDGDADDFLTFDAEANDRISVTLRQTIDNYDLDIELLDGNGDTLAGSYDITGVEEFEYYFFPSDVGPYYLYIEACDGSGLYEIDAYLERVPYWAETVVDDTTSSDLGTYSALVDADGHPACFYYDAVNAKLLYAYSEQTDGSGNWNTYVCDTWSEVGSHLCAAIVNGLPAVAYLDDGAGGVKFAICDSTDGSGTWAYTMIDVNGDRGPSVASINGYPAIAYGDSSGDVQFAVNGEAGGGGSWYVYPVTSTGPGAYSTSLIEISGSLPGIAYDASDDSELHFAVCDAVDGSGTWTTYLVTGFADSTPVSATLVTGNPAFAAVWSGRPTFFRCSNNDGTGGWAGWYASPLSADISQSSISIVSNWGWPRILFEDTDGDLYYAISVDDNGQGEWLTRPVRLDGSVGSNRSLGYVDGNLCCVFFDPVVGYVGFARQSS